MTNDWQLWRNAVVKMQPELTFIEITLPWVEMPVALFALPYVTLRHLTQVLSSKITYRKLLGAEETNTVCLNLIFNHLFD